MKVDASSHSSNIYMRSSCFLGGNFKKQPKNHGISKLVVWRSQLLDTVFFNEKASAFVPLVTESLLGWGRICKGIFPMECEVGSLPNGIGKSQGPLLLGPPLPYHSHKNPLRYGNGMGKLLFHYAWRIIPVSKWLVTPIYKP